MLANAYLPALVAIFGAIVSLILAIVIEIPLLKVIWRRPWLTVAGWVLLANVASALVGTVPVSHFTGPGLNADPWEVSQTWLRTHCLQVALLFGLTLLVEGAVYWFLNLRSKARLSRRRLLAGLLAVNPVSYVVLFSLFALGKKSDCQMLPDTAWLGPTTKRVWYVDAESRKLCSIQLNGTDRRIELDHPLGRSRTGWYDISCYAILPASRSVLFVSPDLDWYIAQGNTIKRLPHKLEFSDPRERWYNEAEATSNNVLSSLAESGPVYSLPYGAGHPVSMSSNVDGSKAWTNIFGGDSGMGLTVSGNLGDLHFGIPSGPAYLACTDPVILADTRQVVFRCTGWIMVMDLPSRRVGKLVRGDSIVLETPALRRDVTSDEHR